MSGYILTLHAYCGLARPIGGAGMNEADACRATARSLPRRRREDFAITVIPALACRCDIRGQFSASASDN
jgi:hypothetical protein